MESVALFSLMIVFMSIEFGMAVPNVAECLGKLPETSGKCTAVEGGRCYYYMDSAGVKPWLAAENVCNTFDAHLPVFRNDQEYWRFNSLRKEVWRELDGRSLPIGLRFDHINFNKTIVSGSLLGWQWVDGSPVNFVRWGARHPDLMVDNSYAYDSANNVHWFDAKSEAYSSVFLCQKLCNVTVPPAPPSPAPPGPIQPPSPKPTNCSSICFAPSCTLAAAALLQSMNTSVDPCTDFYDYACQGWIEKHPIPEDKSDYYTYTYMRQLVNDRIRPLLEEVTGTDVRAIKMAKQYYGTCSNMGKMNQEGSKEVLLELTRLGPMPMLDANWTCPGKGFLTEFLARIHKQYWRLLPLYSIEAQPDEKNTSRMLLYFDQGSNSLGRGTQRYFLDSKNSHIIDALKHMMKASVMEIAKDNSLTIPDPQKDIDDIIEFDKHFAKIIVPSSTLKQNNDSTYNVKKFSYMQQLVPIINWDAYFKILLPPDIQGILNEDTEVIITNITYFQDLVKLLQVTDCRVQMNYVLWRVLDNFLARTPWYSAYPGVLGDKYDDIVQEFMNIYSGRPEKVKRRDACTDATLYQLKDAVGAMYARKYFDEKSRRVVKTMVENVRKAFVENVKKLEWMDFETKIAAIGKVNNTEISIGYQDMALDDELLEKHFSTLHFQPNISFLDMVKNNTQFVSATRLGGLAKPTDRKKWLWLSAAAVNAAYSTQLNRIVYTAGILQPPWFAIDYPPVYNYGAIGWNMGHEIIHGFDARGRKYDKDGNLHNWWHAETLIKFEEKAKCLVDQYSAIEVEGTGLKIDGRRTLTENMADNGGIKRAYAAYKNLITSSEGEEEGKRFPGLAHLTRDQLFFVSAAQIYCGSDLVEERKRVAQTSQYSYPKYRVNIPLKNLPHFAQAFQCQPETPMNPKNRCEIW